MGRTLVAFFVLAASITHAQQTQPLIRPGDGGRVIFRHQPARQSAVARVDGGIAWSWSQPAEWHGAVCRVRSNTSSGGGYSAGSGVLVRYEGCTGVLTAAHVIEGTRTASATFPGGQTVSGNCTHCKFGNDVAWIQVTNPPAGITPLPVGPAQIGQVELCGFGGPVKKLRHYWAQLDRQGRRIVAVSRVASTYGDSGGPWIQAGKVVGINSTVGTSDGSRARHVTGPNGNQWVIGDMAHSASDQAILTFLGRVRQSGFG